MEIDFQAFSNAAPDSLTWYDLMPGDGIRVNGVPSHTPTETLVRLLLSGSAGPNMSHLDILAARLLSGNGELDATIDWNALSIRLSRWMSNNLTVKGSRPLRMRAQRLHYIIQSLVDFKDNPATSQYLVKEELLPGNKPWDQLIHQNVQWWITSDAQNIHCREANGCENHWRYGMPTQIDALADGRLAFGTLYADGAWVTNGTDWSLLPHDRPVVLVFNFGKELLLLDHDGHIIRSGDGQTMGQVPCQQVHFARCFGHVLYCMDNGDFGHITTYDLRTRCSQRYETLPVMVCNDIAVTETAIYLIDKQQGSVFKFDRNWQFLQRKLQFGKMPGRLMDPVSMRQVDGTLQVVNWLSARLTVLKTF